MRVARNLCKLYAWLRTPMECQTPARDINPPHRAVVILTCSTLLGLVYTHPQIASSFAYGHILRRHSCSLLNCVCVCVWNFYHNSDALQTPLRSEHKSDRRPLNAATMRNIHKPRSPRSLYRNMTCRHVNEENAVNVGNHQRVGKKHNESRTNSPKPSKGSKT